MTVVYIWLAFNAGLLAFLLIRSWWEDRTAARQVVAEAERILIEASAGRS